MYEICKKKLNKDNMDMDLFVKVKKETVVSSLVFYLIYRLQTIAILTTLFTYKIIGTYRFRILYFYPNRNTINNL